MVPLYACIKCHALASSKPHACPVQGLVRAVAVDPTGHQMVTAGADKQVKVWDIRKYQALHSYFSHAPVEALDISQRGLLAVGHGRTVQVLRHPDQLQPCPCGSLRHFCITGCSQHLPQDCCRLQRACRSCTAGHAQSLIAFNLKRLTLCLWRPDVTPLLTCSGILTGLAGCLGPEASLSVHVPQAGGRHLALAALLPLRGCTCGRALWRPVNNAGTRRRWARCRRNGGGLPRPSY